MAIYIEAADKKLAITQKRKNLPDGKERRLKETGRINAKSKYLQVFTVLHT